MILSCILCCFVYNYTQPWPQTYQEYIVEKQISYLKSITMLYRLWCDETKCKANRFDCSWVLTHSLRKLRLYEWRKLTSWWFYLVGKHIPLSQAKRWDYLYMKTNSWSNHIALVYWPYMNGKIQILDFYKVNKATVRTFTVSPWWTLNNYKIYISRRDYNQKITRNKIKNLQHKLK